jgi:hypothetical protein
VGGWNHSVMSKSPALLMIFYIWSMSAWWRHSSSVVSRSS